MGHTITPKTEFDTNYYQSFLAIFTVHSLQLQDASGVSVLIWMIQKCMDSRWKFIFFNYFYKLTPSCPFIFCPMLVWTELKFKWRQVPSHFISIFKITFIDNNIFYVKCAHGFPDFQHPCWNIHSPHRTDSHTQPRKQQIS